MYIHAWVTRAVIIVLKRIDDDDGRNEMRRAGVREAMMAAIENDGGVEFGRCPAPHPALDSYGCFHVPLKLVPLFSSVPQLKPSQ